MKYQFKSRAEVERFLREEFPDQSPEVVAAAFEWAFFGGSYRPQETKSYARKRLRLLRRRASELQKSGEAPDELRDSYGSSVPEVVANHMQVEARLEEIWHTNYPKTGGTDPADHAIADWVKMGFEDLGLPITFGVSGHSPYGPSTSFGRIVKAALNWRRSPADWRRLAQSAFEGKGPFS